jgi:hypothetical protein
MLIGTSEAEMSEIGRYIGMTAGGALGGVLGLAIAAAINLANGEGVSKWLTVPAALLIGPVIAACLALGGRFGSGIARRCRDG